MALEEHGRGRSVKVWKAFVKGLRRTRIQALLSNRAATIAHIHAHGRPRKL